MLHIKRAGITFQIASLGCPLPLAMKKLLDVARHNPRDSKKVKNQLPESQSILAVDEKMIRRFLILFTQTTSIS